MKNQKIPNPDDQIGEFNDYVEEITGTMFRKKTPFLRPMVFVKFNRGKSIQMMIMGKLAEFVTGANFKCYEKKRKHPELIIYCAHFKTISDVHEFGKLKTELIFWAFSRFYPGILMSRSFRVTCTDENDLPEDANEPDDKFFEIVELNTKPINQFDHSIRVLLENPIYTI